MIELDDLLQKLELLIRNGKKSVFSNYVSVNPDDVTPTAELINDLGINSLELADLVLLCEERFDITIEDEEVQNFVTVGDVADFLAKKTA